VSVIVRQPTVVAFDFDGTLTRGESFFRFLAFATPWPRFIVNMLLSLPALVLFMCRVISNEDVKVNILKRFLSGRRLSDVTTLATQFATKRIPKTLRPEVVAVLRSHQKQGHTCILVSATLALYLTPWAQHMGFDGVLATELAVDRQGRLTGELTGANCYGPEKAARIQAHFGCQRIKAAYGDSDGDREMLAMAESPHYRFGHGKS
jgi:phosphatidylglycerophosphatase C